MTADPSAKNLPGRDAISENKRWYLVLTGGVAQRSEQAAHNRLVAGSSPAAPKQQTISKKIPMDSPDRAMKAATLEWLYRQLEELKGETAALTTLIRNHPDEESLDQKISTLEARLEGLKGKLEFEKRAP